MTSSVVAAAKSGAETFFAYDRSRWLQTSGVRYLNVDRSGMGYVERQQYPKRDLLSTMLTPENAASPVALQRALLRSVIELGPAPILRGYSRARLVVDDEVRSVQMYGQDAATEAAAVDALLDALLAPEGDTHG